MTIYSVIGLTISETISGTIKNLPFFILIIWGVKIVSKTINSSGEKVMKNIPQWLENYDKMKREHYMIERAMRG